MPIITKITTQQKNKERYNLFLDDGNGEKYAFSVDEGVLVKYQLKKGMELDDFLITEIHYDDDIRKAYNRALQYLTRRIRSESEVRTYLAEKEVDEPIIQEVIIKLYEYQFLNDEQYAIAYVRTQMNTTDKGTVLIRNELKEKGISDKFINDALKEYPYEAQLDKAKVLCEKSAQKNQKDSERVLRAKLEQKLIRKGFGFDIIAEAIEGTNLQRNDDGMEALSYQAGKLKRKFAAETGYAYEQKMKSALYRKGFSLEQIEAYFNQQEWND
ncbi:recombination regulator RecX [Bacillus tuaregi]|uniref:recombination regulator RecX n=1 Tax=Bacillus tuaregi TaxID=1816695 RepID=UPI0008F86AC5|nr:recombination regulator RecX [Bacillus tuaregi]